MTNRTIFDGVLLVIEVEYEDETCRSIYDVPKLLYEEARAAAERGIEVWKSKEVSDSIEAYVEAELKNASIQFALREHEVLSVLG